MPSLNIVSALLLSAGLLAAPHPIDEVAAEGEPAARAATAVALPQGASSELARQYENLRQSYGDTLVTIRFVQKTQLGMNDSAGENEITGVMIAPDGLVLCSNTLLGGTAGRRFRARSVPADIEVFTRDSDVGLAARFLARDTELDLAWLRIKDPGDRAFACIDIANLPQPAPKPSLGERALGLGLMGQYFGQEVLVTESLVVGKTRKPRELYVVRGALDTDPGLPVFTADGRVFGFACFQTPDPDEVGGGMNYASLVARGRGLILPLETVAKATARARQYDGLDEQADDDEEESSSEESSSAAEDDAGGAEESAVDVERTED